MLLDRLDEKRYEHQKQVNRKNPYNLKVMSGKRHSTIHKIDANHGTADPNIWGTTLYWVGMDSGKSDSIPITK